MKKLKLQHFHSREECVATAFKMAVTTLEHMVKTGVDREEYASLNKMWHDFRLVQIALDQPGRIRVEGRGTDAEEILAAAEKAQEKAFKNKLFMLLNQGAKNCPGYLTTMSEKAIVKDLITWRPEYKKEEPWKVHNLVCDWVASKRRKR